jgi:hypothetical protein
MAVDVRPAEGDPVTVLFTVEGAPLSDVTVAGSVSRLKLAVQRSALARALPIEPGVEAAVLFTLSGRLYRWPMRVEEVLPSSYYLVSLREPGEGERREFVRADVPMQLRLRDDALSPWRIVVGRVDLSAAGFRVVAVDRPPGASTIEVEFRSPEGGPSVQAVATVIRATELTGGQIDLACQFVQLGSADESRLVDIVFAARELALRLRLGIASATSTTER